MRRRGWFNDSFRHSLASKGIKTYMQYKKGVRPSPEKLREFARAGYPDRYVVEKSSDGGFRIFDKATEESYTDFRGDPYKYKFIEDAEEEARKANSRNSAWLKANKVPLDKVGYLKKKKVEKESSYERKVEQGMLVEFEHTDDPRIAQIIAEDHIAENPNYYEELKKCMPEDVPEYNEKTEVEPPLKLRPWKSGKSRGKLKYMSLFEPAKNKTLAKMVSLKDPVSAKKSVRELDAKFKSSQARSKKLEIARATNLAAVRAKVQLKRPNLSDKERKEFTEIQKMYRAEADKMFKQL